MGLRRLGVGATVLIKMDPSKALVNVKIRDVWAKQSARRRQGLRRALS
jgi:hypothetical protein